MFDYLDFNDMSGANKQKELKMLALSTCGFCKRAKAFLKEYDIAYSFLDADTLDKDTRKQIRKDFSGKHGKAITFPTLLVGDDDVLIGFIKKSWLLTLELEEK